jgi:alpha-beta hydrolase superfamily lysophospholipase
VVWGEGDRDLLVVHGLAEHAGRYAHVAAAGVARGWKVTVLELRGHGHSGGRRGHVDRWAQYDEDLLAFARTMRPGWRLLAHSMGGLVTLDALEGELARVAPARIALSNPLLGVAVQAPKLKVAAGRLLSKLWPTVGLTNEIDVAGLSRDEAIGQAYAKDPLVYNTITPRWFTEMEAAQVRALAVGRYPLPVSWFLSDKDPIVDHTKAEAHAKRLGLPLKLYPEMRHEILNEIGKEQVIADMLDVVLADA